MSQWLPSADDGGGCSSRGIEARGFFSGRGGEEVLACVVGMVGVGFGGVGFFGSHLLY